MRSQQVLIRDGWEERTTLVEPRLSEVVALYEELGFEVRREPFVPDSRAECSACLGTDPERYRTVYTRRR